MQGKVKTWLGFTAVVSFKSKLLQHVQDINILMLTSQSGKEGGGGKKWGAQTVRMKQRPSDWAKVWGWASMGEKERETVVMINARLPPLCSSEWLQQKAQNNIPEHPLCFSPSLARRLSHSLCVSAGGERLHSQLCRGYAETETGWSTILGSHQQVRVGGQRLGISLNLQLSSWADIIAVERVKKIRTVVCCVELLWLQLINLNI